MPEPTQTSLNPNPILECSPPLILPPFWNGLFSTIEIDFPWQYDDCGFKGWQDVKKYRIHPHYPKMPPTNVNLSFPELARVADPAGAHGWFWVTKDFLPHLFPLLSAHGWIFKQIFTWVKLNRSGQTSYGMGYWCRNACEFLVFAILPNKDKKKSTQLPMLPARTSTPNFFVAPDTANEDPEDSESITEPESGSGSDSCSGSVLFAPKSNHSAKPDLAYEIMSSLSPAPRLSIFQRTKRPGWKCWGWEMEGSIPIPQTSLAPVE